MAKRKLVWCRSYFSNVLTAAADADVLDLLSNFRGQMGITANLPGTTVVRSHIALFSANSQTIPLWVGLRKMPLRDVTEANADAVYSLAQGPGSNAYTDWMGWGAYFPNHGADPVTGVPNALTYEMDVRSMRKLDDPADTMTLVVEKALTAAPATVIVASSILLALP